MNPLLKDLMETQFLSDEMVRLEKECKQTPLHLAKLDSQLQTTRKKRDAIVEHIQKTELTIRKSEGLVKDARDQQGKLRAQMFTTKSNREYQALNASIDAMNDKISQYETGIIESLDFIDDAKQQLLAAESNLKAEEIRIARATEQLNVVFKEDKRRLQEVSAAFEKKRKELPEEQLQQYDKLVRKNGRAVAILDQTTCGNCFIKVQPQVAARIFGNSNLVQCDKCSVFLYVSEIPGR